MVWGYPLSPLHSPPPCRLPWNGELALARAHARTLTISSSHNPPPTTAGRNFEYQGEDPVLAAKMVASEIAGIQSQNVSGCVKQ